jgi:hypothetical protein
MPVVVVPSFAVADQERTVETLETAYSGTCTTRSLRAALTFCDDQWLVSNGSSAGIFTWDWNDLPDKAI